MFTRNRRRNAKKNRRRPSVLPGLGSTLRPNQTCLPMFDAPSPIRTH
jgi:hypothetical protein